MSLLSTVPHRCWLLGRNNKNGALILCGDIISTINMRRVDYGARFLINETLDDVN